MATQPSTFDPPKIVLITGINGYIASHIGVYILNTYPNTIVRGTSRSPSAEDALRKGAFLPFSSWRYQHVVVPDITTPGAFNEAVQGVFSIIHTASPVDFSLRSTDAFFTPAIQGVTSILNSALAETRTDRVEGSVLSSFVLTSSIAAIVDRWRHPPPALGGTEVYAYSERDWNIVGESIARKSEAEGAVFLPMVAYGASKAGAERAMWEWAEARAKENKGSASVEADTPPFALSSVCPGVTMGVPVQWPEGPEGLNETLKPIWNIFCGAAKKAGMLPPLIGGQSYVDVRDVARLHAWCAMEVEEQKRRWKVNDSPDGQGRRENRYLCTNGKGTWQAVADILRDRVFSADDQETQRMKEKIIVGDPRSDHNVNSEGEVYGFPEGEPSVWSDRAYEALGLQRGGFRSLEDCIKEMAVAFAKRWPEYLVDV